MLNNIKESYEELIKSKEFKNPGFLCSFFVMSDINKLNQANWQIDFYNEKSKTMNSYNLGKNIKPEPELEVFKEKETEIEELNLEEVKLEFKDAIEKAENSLKKHNEETTTIIIVLQKISKAMWNISYITKKFNLLNIKINAENGSIIEEKLVSLLSFKKN